MGWSSRQFQYWLPNAVKSNGAVSPATRAKASITPVMTPDVAVRSVIESVVRQRGTPRSVSRFPENLRNQQQHLFGGASDCRHHHDGQRDTAGER